MSTDTQELIRICEKLPEDQRAEVADFARFLLAKHEDDAWERTIADTRPRPRLDEFVREALAEGSEPLDVDKLSVQEPSRHGADRCCGRYAPEAMDKGVTPG